MTATSGTSPRALRAARQGGAAQPQEQEQEGRVDLTATGEARVEAVGAGEEETDSAAAAAAAGLGDVPAAGAAAAVALEMAESGPAAPAAPEMAAGVSAAVPDAASDDGSVPLPSAAPQIQSTPAGRGPAAVAARTTSAAALQPSPPEQADSPAPVGSAEVAAVVAAAVGRREADLNGDAEGAGGLSSETPAAAADVDTPERAQQVDDRSGCAVGGGYSPSRARASWRFPRAQPAPRRLGAGLGPGAPGPLLGWLLQGQTPRGQEHPPPSRGRSPGSDAAAGAARQAATPRMPVAGLTAADAGTDAPAGTTAAPTAGAAVANETGATPAGARRSARLGTITWGPPRGGRTPWMPAGRGGHAGTRTAGVAGRGNRGSLRGGLRGGRGGRNVAPRSEIPVRTGPWRERHARPEREQPQTNGEQGVSDDPDGDLEFMAGEEEVSEEISLDDEEAPRRRSNPRPQSGEAAERIPGTTEEQGGEATGTRMCRHRLTWLATMPSGSWRGRGMWTFSSEVTSLSSSDDCHRNCLTDIASACWQPLSAWRNIPTAEEVGRCCSFSQGSP
ncbi:unnamed protein product [Closterium sp. Yama58-4]|nr:unnamed protein product [Closterium sp. Yama58-4]